MFIMLLQLLSFWLHIALENLCSAKTDLRLNEKLKNIIKNGKKT